MTASTSAMRTTWDSILRGASAAVLALAFVTCVMVLRLVQRGSLPLALESWAGLALLMAPAASVLIALPTSLALLIRRPLWRTLVSFALAAALAATAISLTVTGHVKADGRWEVAAGFLFLAGFGCVAAAYAFRGLLSRWLTPWTGAILLVVTVLVTITDPGRLRGTYGALDLALLGLALALATAGMTGLLRATTSTLAGVVLAALLLLLAIVVVPGETARGPLLGAAPSHRILDRLSRWMLRRSQPEGPSALFVDEKELFALPPSAADVRAKWQKTRENKPRLNVLWVTIDALRFDATGLGGGKLTPNLDAFAERSVAFERAWAQGPGTSISTESMFRGRHPASRYDTSLTMEEIQSLGPEGADHPPISTLLKRVGYHSALVTGLQADEIGRRMFVALPFGFETQRMAEAGADAAIEVDHALSVIEATKDRPFFVWLHLFDAHAPYEAREGCPKDATPRERWGSEVRYADRQFGRLISELEKRGLSEDTVVVVNADHGEAFGEHGRYFHATSYYDVQIRVPLVIHAPGMPPAVVKSPVGNVEIVPTLLELLAMERPSNVQTESLLPVMYDPTLAWPRATFAETQYITRSSHWAFDRIRMATDGRMKLLYFLDDGLQLLFDLDRDPLEKQDLSGTHQQEVKRLLGYLDALDRHLGRAVDAPQAAVVEKSGLDDPSVVALLDPDRARREVALLQLFADQRSDLIPAFEEILPKLTPEAAHTVLLLLDLVVRPERVLPPHPNPWPEQPGPVRYRLTERHARDPRYARLAGPTFSNATPLDEVALREVRAARGDVNALRELRTIEPACRAAWDHLASTLSLGGDRDGDLLTLSGLRARTLPKQRFASELEIFAVAGSSSLGDALAQLWPSPEVYFPERGFARFVSLALEHPALSGVDGLLALHSRASPGDQRRLTSAIAERKEEFDVDRASKLWTAARFENGSARAKDLYTELEGLLPPSLEVPALRREIAWGRGRDTARGTLAAEFSGLPTSATEPSVMGPVRVTLRAETGEVALGALDHGVITFTWVNGAARVLGGLVGMPRELLAGSHSLTVPVALDYPKADGDWVLEAVSSKGDRVSVLGRAVYRVDDVRSFEGPQIARRFRGLRLPPRPFAEGTLIEIPANSGDTLTFSGQLPAGDYDLTIDLEVSTEDSEDYVVRVVSGAHRKRVGTALKGIPQTLRASITVEDGKELAVVWPRSPHAVILLRRISFLAR